MQQKVTFLQSLKAGLFAGITAAIINAILFYIFHAAGIITDDISLQPDMPMTIVPVLMSSIIPSIIASFVFFLFEKFSSKGFRNFKLLSIILLIASFANPFLSIPNVPLGYALALNIMHIPPVIALFYFIGKAVKATQK